MAKAKRKSKKTNKKKKVDIKTAPKPPEVLTREQIEAEVKALPPEELLIDDDEGLDLEFIPDPNLDPSNPDDLEAINKEAEQFRRKVQEPAQEQEVKEAEKQFDRIIETEADFLKHFRPDNLELKIIHNGELINFHIKPLEPGDDFSKLSVDKDVFADIDMETRIAIVKRARSEPTTERENKLLKDMDQSKTVDMQSESLATANSILSQFVTPPAFEDVKDPKERQARRLEFWKGQPYVFKLYLAGEVGKRLGLDLESRFSIFQPSGDS